MHLATRSGHTAIVHALLRYRASVQVMDQDSNTPMHLAVQSGDITTVRLLSKYSSVTSKNKNGYSPYQLALANGHSLIARWLSWLSFV